MLKLILLALALASIEANQHVRAPMQRRAVTSAMGNQAFDDAAKQAIVDAHNKYRHEAGSMPDVEWDDSIADVAVNWAGCDDNWFTHSSGGPYGENLYFSGSSQPYEESAIASMAVSGVGDWNSEVKDYNYGSNSCSAVCGHYTQVVWAKTTKIGCGYALNCPQGQAQFGLANTFYLVCNYDPPGNWVGEKPY